MTSIGQGAPAMTPVRKRREIEASEILMVEHGDEHGRDAIDRGAALARDRLQCRARFEAFARKYHRRTLGGAAQCAHHHAEAMIERHRDAQPIILGQRHGTCHEAGIVDDVGVGERGALRRAGSAGSELDVDRFVGIEIAGKIIETQPMRRATNRHDLVEIQHALGLLRPDADHGLEPRQAGAVEAARFAFVDLGCNRAQLRDVVGTLEARGQNQRLAADLVEREFKLRHAIGRIDVDEDET